MGKDDEPGPKGTIIREPELKVGDKVKIRQIEGLPDDAPSGLDPKGIYTVSKVEPQQFRSCFFEEDDCRDLCNHFEECKKEFDEVYADLIIQQTVTLLEKPDNNYGSCWFDKV